MLLFAIPAAKGDPAIARDAFGAALAAAAAALQCVEYCKQKQG